MLNSDQKNPEDVEKFLIFIYLFDFVSEDPPTFQFWLVRPGSLRVGFGVYPRVPVRSPVPGAYGPVLQPLDVPVPSRHRQEEGVVHRLEQYLRLRLRG